MSPCLSIGPPQPDWVLPLGMYIGGGDHVAAGSICQQLQQLCPAGAPAPLHSPPAGKPNLAKENEHSGSSLEEISVARCPLEEEGLGREVLLPRELEGQLGTCLHCPGLRVAQGIVNANCTPSPGRSVPSLLSAWAVAFCQPRTPGHGVQLSFSTGLLVCCWAPSRMMSFALHSAGAFL